MNIEDIAAHLSGHINISLQLEPNSPEPLLIIPPQILQQAAHVLRDDRTLAFKSLLCLSGIERNGGVEEVITLYSEKLGVKLSLKVKAEAEAPALPSVTSIWPAADWHEREAYDMFGIVFEGHPDHRRILCPDDWDGFPLRKNYQAPLYYHDIPVTVNVPGGTSTPATRKDV